MEEFKKKESTISRSGIWSKLYTFFYRERLPNGLCPFFWSNFIAVIFIIPYTFIVLPLFIGSIFPTNNDDEDDDTLLDRWSDDAGGRNFLELTFICIFAWLLIILIISVLIGMYNFFTPGFQNVEILGGIGVLGIISTGISYIWKESILSRYKEWKYQRKLAKAIVYNESLPEDLRLNDKYWIIDNYEDRPRDSSNWEITKDAIRGWYDRNCPVIIWTE